MNGPAHPQFRYMYTTESTKTTIPTHLVPRVLPRETMQLLQPASTVVPY